ncbi:MAG: hypothetical protein WDO19_06190 [Bacteroidota bacterium]
MTSERKIAGNILYREEQLFRVKWLWIILLICVFSSLAVTIAIPAANKQELKGKGIGLAIIIPLETLLLYLFYSIKLETVVSREGVYYRWSPFFKRYWFIDKKEIEETKADNGPVLSYGFHFVPGYGSVHNMGPGKGIRFIY